MASTGRLKAAALLALGSAGLFASHARAGNSLWVGNTSGNFGTAANWNGNALPVTNNTLEFHLAGTAGTNLTDNFFTPGSYQLSGITFDTGASAFVINPAAPLVNAYTLGGNFTDNATNTETFNDAITLATTPTFSVTSGGTLNLGGSISGLYGITVTGGGTLNLSAAESYTGATTVSQGTVNVSNTIATGSSTITVGNVLNNNAVLNIHAGSNIAGQNLLIGTNAAGSGAVYQSGGFVNLSQSAGTTNLAIGNVTGGYGYYNISAGTVVTNEVDIGAATGSNYGVMDISGGTVADNGAFYIQHGTGGGGVLNVTGGSFYGGEQLLSGSQAVMLSGTNATAQLSVTNGYIQGASGTNGTGNAYPLSMSATGATGLSVININNAGELQVSQITANSTSSSAVTLLNFNGGTLKYAGANQTNSTAATNTAFLTSSNITGVYVYGGGGTIDSNGGAITITKQLQAPTGDGVSAVPLTGLTTTGYIGSPVVNITGGSGTGATGVAVINSSGVLTGITITNPGTGYLPTDSLTITLNGGGVASSTATNVTPTFVANTNTGGMTFNGYGQITLASPTTDTYMGTTAINGGQFTLDFSQSGSLSSNIVSPSSPLALNGVQFILNGRSGATLSQTFNGTTLGAGGTRVIMTPNSANSMVLNLGNITRQAAGTINLNLSGTSSSTNGVITSTANNAAGILGGWATVGTGSAGGSEDWATNSAGNLIALPSGSYTTLNTSGGTYTTNFLATTNTTLTGNLVANSLKLSTGVTALTLGSNNLTLNGTSGGLMIAGSASPTISGTGILSAGTGNEFIIQDWSSGTTTISAPILGNNDSGSLTITGAGNLTISSTNSYTGGTTISGCVVTVTGNNALGTGPILLNAGGVSNKNGIVPNSYLVIGSGVTISNSITMNGGAPVATGIGGEINASAGPATINGNVTLLGQINPGGDIIGPTGSGQYLTITGTLNKALGPDNSTFLSPSTGYTSAYEIDVRSGNLKLDGGGNYYRLDERLGTLQIGANNGIATNASVDVGANGTSVVDLNGYNQSLTAISTTTSNSNSRTITNSSTTSSSTLTLTPLAAGQIDSNLAFGGFSATGTTITDSYNGTSSLAVLNIIINGDPTGVQGFNASGYTYHGSTTLTSGTLSIVGLANGGSASSIGASTNAASNLVFGGGTLLYQGSTASTDRSFTVLNGSTGTINVASSSAVVTFSSAGGVASSTGSFNKLGAGTLTFSGPQGYTGMTNVGAGTFQLAPTGSLAGGISVAAGSTFIAAGATAGTTTLGPTSIFVPGASAFTAGTVPTITLSSGANYSTGGLVLQKLSTADFAFSSSNVPAVVNDTGPLSIFGGSLDFTTAGSASAFSTNGTYTLINYNGSGGTTLAGSVNNFSIVNAVAGKAYAFTNTGTQIQLTISTASVAGWTNNDGDNQKWNDNANWTPNTIPNAASATANFGSTLVPADGTVNLASTNETVGYINLDNTSTPGNVSFTIESTGTGVLTLSNGLASPQVNVVAGAHAITAPLTLNAPVSGGTTFNVSAGSSLTLGGTISAGSNGAQTVYYTGAGTVILTTASDAIANHVVQAGTLQIGAGGSTGTLGTGAVSLSAGTTLAFNLGSDQTVTSVISGPGAFLNQSGSAVVTLSPTAQNTVGTVGGVNITSGTLKLGNANALPSGVIMAVNGGTLDLNTIGLNVASLTGGTSPGTGGVITDSNTSTGTTVLTDSWAGSLQTYYGTIADGPNRHVGLAISGGGTVAMGSSNTYSGGTQLSNGTLQVPISGALGTGAVTLSGLAVNLQIGNGVTLSNKIVVDAANPLPGNGALTTITNTDTATFSGEIDYYANLSTGGSIVGPTGGGVLSFTGPIIEPFNNSQPFIQIRAGIVQLADVTGNSSYPELLVSTATASLGHNNGMATNAVLALNGGTMDLNGYNQTVAGLALFTGATAGTITDTNGAAQGGNTNPNPTGPNSSSVLTVNTTAAAYPDSTPDIYAGNINNYIQLVKTGAGTLSLTGSANSYFGGTIIQQGVLAVAVLDNGNTGSPNGLGESLVGAQDLVFASPGGTLRYTGTTGSTSRSFTINDGVTATMDVSSAASTLTVTGNASVDNTEASNPASFAKGPGPGTLVLTGSYPYHGNTTVSGGTLLVNGSTGTAGSGSIIVAAGATLGGTGTVSGSFNHTAGTIVGGASPNSPTNGSLTFTDPVILNGGIDLNNIDASQLNSGTVNQQGFINAAGGLTLGSTPETISLQFSNTLGSGNFVYNLFQYSGTLHGTPHFTYTSNFGRTSFTTDLSTAGEINVDINYLGAANLYWNSASSSVWDVYSPSNASTGTANWFNAGTNAVDKFQQGDNVVFADSGTVVGTHTLPTPLQTNITVNAAVSPASVTVSSTSSNYNFSGTGSITGTGALSLNGGSTLTLALSNSYTGGTNLNAGTLNLANNGAIGSVGTISFGGGILQYSAANNVDYSSRFSTANNQQQNIDTNGQSITFASNLTSAGGSLTKLGAGTLTLAGSNTYTGNTVLTGGTLAISASANLNGGGPIIFNGGSLDATASVTLNNNVVVNSSGGSLTNTAALFLNGSLTGSGTLVSSSSAPDVLAGTAFTAGNNSPAASFTGTIISEAQVNILDISASPYANYNAASAGPGTFIIGDGNYVPSGPIQLGSLSGVAGASFRTTSSVTIGGVTLQVGNLGINTTYAGNIFEGNGFTPTTNTISLVKVGSGNLTLSGSNAYTGGTTVNAGSLTFASSTAFPSNGTNGTSLTVASGAMVTIANHGTGTTYVPQISNLSNSGVIDITNNALLVHNGSVSTINSEVGAAYNGGAWNGTNTSSGVITSSTAAADPSHLTAVGVATNLTSFEGQTVLTSDVLVKYTYYGDANLDGHVDGSDYSLIDYAYEFNQNPDSSPLTGWYNGDFNYDGVIDGSDYTLMDNAFNQQGASISAQLATETAQIGGSSSTSAVPEPASLGLLSLGAIGLLGRRSRRHR
jgi:autotransporter-associated beta strand protein